MTRRSWGKQTTDRVRCQGSPGRAQFAIACASGLAALLLALPGDPVFAQPSSPSSPAVAQASRPLRFNIPAQPLVTALRQFADQAGLQFAYTTADLQGLSTRGVAGTHAPEDALRILLAGSGVSWRFTGTNTVTLSRAPAPGAVELGTVTVEGRQPVESAYGPVQGYVATRSATATKTDTPLLETPQSISVVTSDQIKAQGAQRIEQALSYTPGVVVGSYGSNPEQDYVFARGFHVPLYFDGIRQYRDYITGAQVGIEPYGLERIEVLRGPSSVLYGQIAPGGMVNMIAKRPLSTPLRQIALQAGNFDRRQAAFDIGDRLDDQGQFLFRLTGLARDADGQMDFQGDDRLFLAPAFSWQPTDRTRLTLLSQFQRDSEALRPVPLPAEGTLFSNPNGRLSTSRFLGEPAFDSFDRDQYMLGYELEHAFNDALSFRQNVRYTNVKQHEDYTLTMFDGSFLSDFRTVDRQAWDDRNRLGVFGIDNQLQAKVDTGPVGHTLLFGFEFRRATNDWLFSSASMSPIDAYDPQYGTPLGPFAVGIDQYQRERQLGVYVQDQLAFERWRLTLGLRQDWAKGITTDRLAGTTQEQDDERLTGRAGLTYLFDIGVAPYVSYSTSFEPETGLDGQGRPFKATTAEQYEIGVKYQPPGHTSFVAASVFDLTRQNVLTRDPNPPPTNPFAQVQTGEVNVRGFELEGKATLIEGLDVLAAYTYFDSEVTKSNTANLGRPLYFTPEHQFALWADYTVQRGSMAGFGIGAGLRLSRHGLRTELRDQGSGPDAL